MQAQSHDITRLLMSWQWSRDGRFLVYAEIDPNTKRDIWVLPLQTGVERKPLLFLRTEFNDQCAAREAGSSWPLDLATFWLHLVPGAANLQPGGCT